MLLLAAALLLGLQQQVISLPSLPGVSEYEVVVPQKLYSRHRRDTQTKYPEEVHYALKVQGEDVEVRLKRNENLFAEDYTQTHYLTGGQEVTDSPLMMDHCYYHGHVKNDSDSEASISLCNGVRGYFKNQGQRYLIEPLELSQDEHAVYKYESLESSTPRTCGVTDTTWEDGPVVKSSRSRGRSQDLTNLKKYVKLVVVADTSMFKKYNNSVAQVQQRIYEIINYVNLVYVPLNTFVALTGTEVWSDVDRFPVNTSASVNLNTFSSWRARDLLQRKPNDNAQFLTNVDFDGATVGLAYVGTMCASDHSTGVIQDHSKISISVGATIAHEMGHNIGMSHDTSSCTCTDSSCIMSASLSYVTPKLFSSCSFQSYQAFLQSRSPTCLTVVPNIANLVAPPVCGNGFVEAGEQCDCGTPQACQNPCCNAASCTLVATAQCADGDCCANCQIKPAGVVCRPAVDDCDLGENCDGQSPTCPSNRFRVNGYPCSNGAGYCYNGTCPTRLGYCNQLWGASAVVGDATACFSKNKLGTNYGYCTYSGGKFVACAATDVMCGKLFCFGGSDTPTVYASTVLFKICKALIPSSGIVPNFAMVQNGTKCGDGLVCNLGKCVNMQAIYRSANCSSKCIGHAVCDHELKCQCEEGWAPPTCDSASGTNIIIIIVVVLILAVAIAAVLVFLWYRGTFKTKGESDPATVSGANNQGFVIKKPVIVQNPEPSTRPLLPSPPTPSEQADKAQIYFMSSAEGQHLAPTKVGYCSPQYVVQASPSPDPGNRSQYANAGKLTKPSTAPPPVPLSKPTAPPARGKFGASLNIPPPAPAGKPLTPKPSTQALMPPSSRP